MTDLSMLDPTAETGAPPPGPTPSPPSGFTTGPILGDLDQQAQPATVPFGAFDGQEWFSAIKQAGRGIVNNISEYGQYDEYGHQVVAPLDKTPAADLQARYGIADPDSPLKFQNDLPEDVAQSMHDAKVAELDRRAIASMSPQTFWSQAERFGAGFVTNALDPLNIAAAFIPVVGETRYAMMLDAAGGAIGRFGVRAAVGAAQGAAGQVPLSALRYGLSRAEQADYSATDALLDVAYGGLLGGGLHAAGGAAGDALTGAFRASPEAAMADADLGTRESALRTSLAQVMSDRPVEVQPVFDTALARGVSPPESDLTAPPAAPLDVERGDDDNTRLLGQQRAKREPQTLPQFIAANGGMRDDGGELAAMDLHQPQAFQPGFGPVVRAKGLAPDAMRERAELAGFIRPDKIDETTTMADLYDAIDQEMKSGRDYGQPADRTGDPAYEAHLAYLDEMTAHDAPELGEEGLYEEFAKLAARDRSEDVGSHGRHDEFDIPWDDVSGPGEAGAEAGGGAPDAGRGGSVAAREGAGREDTGEISGDEGRSLDAGGQAVIPGAERITDKALAERGMEGGLRATIAQKGADEGLFDVAGRAQRDMFDAPNRLASALKAAAGDASPELQSIIDAADAAQKGKAESGAGPSERRSPTADATPPLIRAQTDDLQALADHLRQVGDLPKDSDAELTAADAGVTRAGAIAKGLASAAQCLIAEGL